MTFIPQQDELSLAPHPIDMLERTVEDNGWAFERSGRDELNLSVAGKWSDHHFSFTWRDDLKSLHLSSTFDMRITEDVRRQNVADLLMYVNARLWIGHFDLWHEDGTVVFRHAMIFPGAEASPGQCEALLNLALEACEHYYPAFQYVIWGGKSAKEAVDAAVLECAGAGVTPGPKARNNKVLLVGAGRMGSALLKGWLKQGLGPITVAEPKPSADIKALAKKKKLTLVKAPSQLAAKKFSVCVVAVKPQILKTEAVALKNVAAGGALMLSIAAGTDMGFLSRAWGGKARIIRAMPNTPGAIGQGITGLYAAKGTAAADRKRAGKMLSALGETVWVETEDLIDSITAVSGSGPAYLFLMAEALTEAGIVEGLSRAQAEKLARATVSGAGALLAADKSSAAALRQAVTSPGGTTEAALKVLMADDGLAALIKRAVHAARERAEELR